MINIFSKEVNKTYYSWLIKLIFRIGIIIGWTSIVAVFISHFGISRLPFLFMIQSIFTIVGMLAFSFLVERFHIKTLITISCFLASIMFFLAALFHQNQTLFFVFSIFGYGVFVPQIAIFSSNYIEDFFTPWECEKVAPILESSETIGGIVGGIFLATLPQAFAGYKVLYIWIFSLFAFLAVLYIFSPNEDTSVIVHHRLNTKSLQKSLTEIRRVPFLQALLLVFVVQWIITNLLEFQFTRVVDSSIGAISSVAQHEASLTHNLGSLQIILNFTILLVEFLAGSRILKVLGTFGGFLLHAIVTFLSFISLFFGFGYFSTILARNNFEITTIVHRNAYEASYFALRHGTQRAVREFFEAFLMPLAVIISTTLLIFVESFFVEGDDLAVVRLLLLFLALAMVFFSYYLKGTYTSLAKDLLRSTEIHSKMHGIEILSQKGHQNSFEILIEELNRGHEDQVVVKIIHALAKLHHKKALPHLLSFANHKNPVLKTAAVEALSNLKYNGADELTS